jgi:hypothetical protein
MPNVEKEIIATPLEVSYFAGLCDGEAWIGVGRLKTWFQPAIKITMVEELPLRWAHGIFGGQILFNRRQTMKEGRPVCVLTWHGKALRTLLPVLIPYLRLKVKQATLVYEISLLQGAYRGRPTPVVKDRQRAIYAELKRLNRRGTRERG